MHTKDFLAQELEAAGLHDMAVKAAAGYYDDYLSPLPFPDMTLDDDLTKIGTPEALDLRDRCNDGEFDSSLEECDDWVNSADGQAALQACGKPH